jgi:hypothetical protein
MIMRKSHPSLKGSARRAADVARDEQAIRQQTDRAEKAQAGAKEKSGPMQAGSQPYPAACPQHVSKSGEEAEIEPQPR